MLWVGHGKLKKRKKIKKNKKLSMSNQRYDGHMRCARMKLPLISFEHHSEATDWPSNELIRAVEQGRNNPSYDV